MVSYRRPCHDERGRTFLRQGPQQEHALGPNGQNIYPEEIEDKLNSMAMVNESIVLQKGDKLVGLVHPDMDEANTLGFTQEDLENIMEQNRKELNEKYQHLPSCRAFSCTTRNSRKQQRNQLNDIYTRMLSNPFAKGIKRSMLKQI